MQKFKWNALKWFFIFILIAPLLVACGQYELSETYPLESVSRDGKSTSYIYRAENRTVPDIVKELVDKRTPKQTSAQNDERMFLIYDKEVIQVQRDKEKQKDTIIEVDSHEYVKQNYDRSFLAMYFQYKLLDTLFDSLDGYGKYRGYNERRTYEPAKSYQKPTLEDKKKAPPVTIQRRGSIFRRGTSMDTSKNLSEKPLRDTGENIFTRQPRVKNDKRPRTRVGSGTIFRRSRR